MQIYTRYFTQLSRRSQLINKWKTVRTEVRKFIIMNGSLFVLLLLCGCGPKEKGKVTVSSFLYNRSGYKLLVTELSSSATDTVYNNAAISLAGRVRFRSRSKPLCCPCAADVGNFSVTVADSTKKLVKNLEDPLLWEKQTQVRIDNWNCRITIEPEDIVPK
jgi:hypothetical protein